jgi:3'(2'), 5'-bisphosphate nucleotidase
MDSQAKYAALSLGKADIYLRVPRKKEYREKIWDHAAGSIILKEAGGDVTDLDGKPLNFSKGRTLKGNFGIVASIGKIHQKVLGAVSRVIRKLSKV